jgi:hypothetical protein
VLREFIESTDPGAIEDADWGSIVEPHSPRSRQPRSAAA